MGQMCFEFGSQQERDEFLVLNDLQLAGDGAIVDRERHVVGRLGDDVTVEIREGSHHGLRTAEWWLFGPGPEAPEGVEEEESDEESTALVQSAQRRLSALFRRSRLQPEP